MPSSRWTPEQLAEYQARRPQSYAPPSFYAPKPKGSRAFWNIVPAPWVRESNKDKFKPRLRVLRYRAFRKEVALRKVWAPTPGDLVVFMMPIPKSWTDAKKLEMDGRDHTRVPDVDNLCKALLDACFTDDAHIWTLIPAKVWSATPGIYIERRDPPIAIPFTLPQDLAA